MPTRSRLIGSAVLIGALAVWGLSAPGCGPQGGGGAAVPPHLHKAHVSGNTYIDETFNCKVSAPGKEWTIEPAYEDIGDGRIIVKMLRSVYNAWVMLGVSKHHQPTLEAWAGVGTYNPRIAKFTYMAGKPCHYSTKSWVVQGSNLECTSIGYKFVSNNIGYLISVAYPSMWSQDDKLIREVDELMNSFQFLRGEPVIERPAGAPAGKPGKLTHVAILEMIDLAGGKPTATTQSLTNELQVQCARTGRFELLERRRLKGIRDERRFRLSGMISGESAVETGKLLGARYLISGNCGHVGHSWVVYAQITDAKSGKILTAASVRRKKGRDEDLLDAMPVLAQRLAASVSR